MFALTVRQRIAALVLLAFLALGGLLIFLSDNRSRTREYVDDATNSEIYADVRGAVAKPGLIRLKPGSRKYEALQLVGGALPEADLNRINQAEFVEDGEQIYLPKKGEIIEVPSRKRSSTNALKQSLKQPRVKKGKAKQSGTPPKTNMKVQPNSVLTKTSTAPQLPIDVNSADQTQLEAVPGIGQFLAAKIIEYRNKNGSFQSYEDLDKVYGIGPVKLTKLRPYLCVQ